MEKHRRTESTCHYCKKSFMARIDLLKRGNGRFCSVGCALKGRKRVDQRGSKNPNWKGGISKFPYRYKLTQAERYPERISARGTAYSAIRRGKIKREPCEVCGAERVEAHHDDYSKPLVVRWLCRQHHRELHEAQKGSIDGMV